MPLFYFRLCDLIFLPGFLSPGLSSQPGYPRAALEDTGSINVYTRLQNTLCCSVVFRRIEHFFKNLISLPGTGKFHRTIGDLASREKLNSNFALVYIFTLLHCIWVLHVYSTTSWKVCAVFCT